MYVYHLTVDQNSVCFNNGKKHTYSFKGHTFKNSFFVVLLRLFPWITRNNAPILRCQHSLRLMWLWICARDRNKNSVATDFQWQAHYFRGIKSLRQPRSGPTHFHSIPISNTWHQKTNKTTLPCCTPHSITNYNVVIDTISLEIPSSATSAMHFPMTSHPICEICL